LAQLARDFNLDGKAAYWLEATIANVITDLEENEDRRSRTPPPSKLKSRLKKLESLLFDLKEEMERGSAEMIHFLPHETLARIGLAMNFSTMGEALGENVSPKRIDDKIRAGISDGQTVTLAQLEKESRPAREVLGLKHGDKILRHFIDAIHEPLRRWLELDKQNKGDAPARAVRRYLIYWLALSAPRILGKKPGVSQTGPFVELCAVVLRACGESDEGVEKLSLKW
jgi:hypothetical protein